MYTHHLRKWPNFEWDQKGIEELLLKIRYSQGRLVGGMNSIGFESQREALLQTLTQDVVKSSEIEGEILDRSLVRSSVARHLGIEIAASAPKDRNIEGVVEMLLDATIRFDHDLTKERLLKWHATLFPDGMSGFQKIQSGFWRSGIAQVISGYGDRETIHFEAPRADLVDQEMKQFLKWINTKNEIDNVLKAAIAHLWFVTVHPFDDGNGRIGRAIADMLLTRSEDNSLRYYSLSSQIQKERKHYYAILEKTQKGDLNITEWIMWFLNCLARAIESALLTLDMVLNKVRYFDLINKISLNTRQQKIINRLLEDFHGNLTSTKWAKMAKCSQDTAYRDIIDLVNKGILLKNPGSGRSTSYSLVNLP